VRVAVARGGLETATGTGFVVDRVGHMLTAGHVVDGAGSGDTRILVAFSGGRGPLLGATVVRRTTSPDLALLRVETRAARLPEGLEPLPIALAAGFRDASELFTYGFRRGERRATLQSGRVGRVEADFVRFNAPLTPGYSGGPAVFPGGDVVVGLVVSREDAGHVRILRAQRLVSFLAGIGVAPKLVPTARGADGVTRAGSCPLPLQLPTRIAGFVGRQGELEILGRRLSAGQEVGVSGIGGVGKTALVNEALWRMWESGATRGGVVWVEVGRRSPSSVAADIARALCREDLLGRLGDPRRALAEMAPALARRRTIVVLDDVRRDEVEGVLLDGLRGTAFVETRRPTLRNKNIRPENRIELEGLAPGPCRQLFARRAALPPSAGQATLDEICRLLSYQPLAVEIAAERYLEDRPTLADFAAEMGAMGLRGLTVGRGLHQDLAKNFARTVERLTPRQRALYRALGVFRVGAPYALEAVAWVADRSPGLELSADLRRLRRLRLLDKVGNGYRQHDLLRQDAAVRLDGRVAERKAAERRYVAYYEKHAASIDQTFETSWDTALEQIEPHMFAAFELVAERYGARGDEQTARDVARWAWHLRTYASRRSVGRAEPWLLAGYEAAARLGDGRKEAGLALAIGSLLGAMGRARDWIAWSERSLAAAGRAGDRQVESAALGNLGIAYKNVGEYRTAIEFHERGLAIARALRDRRAEAGHLGNLGVAYQSLGEYRKAIEQHERALAISRELVDLRGEGLHLGNLGLVHRTVGEPKAGIPYLEQALSIGRELGDRRMEGRALAELGNVYLSLGELQRAVALHQESLAIARDTGDRGGEGNSLGNLGLAFRRLGRRREAQASQEQALGIYRDIGDRRGEGRCLGNLGNIHRDAGRYDEAIAHYEQALAIARDIGDGVGQADRLANLGSAYAELGDAGKARAYLAQARGMYEAMGSQRARAMEKALDALPPPGAEAGGKPVTTPRDSGPSSMPAR